MDLYLGIDVGSFESKGVLVDRSGAVIAQAARRHKMLVPRPGWAEHRPKQDWWGDFTALSKALLASPGVDRGAVRAVAVSAIGPCMLPVDENGEALANAVLYGVDTRAVAEIEALDAEIGRDRIFELSGNSLSSQAVGPKILWLKKNRPEIFAGAAEIVTSTTYLVRKLTGRSVIDHYTAANFNPLYLLAERGWSAELAPDLIALDRLPEILWSSEIAGQVTRAAARATGLPEGTPVTTGTIDAAAEALSVGVIEPGDMMMMYGSTVFTIMLSDRRLADHRLWYAPWLFPGEHASMAGLATSGTLTHWFHDVVARELPADSAFPALTAEAERSPPGARGLLMLPYFSGERTPLHDYDAKGVIFGLNLTHTRGDMFRALLEGISFATNAIFDTYREIGAPPRRLLAVGGGTKNPVWHQATSDISGLAQTVCRHTFGASYGDAFLAALALGDVKLSDIRRWNPVARRIRPDPRHAALYRARYAMFQELYRNNRATMAALS